MAIVKRVKLDSWVRRVRLDKPVLQENFPGAVPPAVFEHVYREVILVAPGGVDNDLPPELSAGLPGVPDLPSTGLPDDTTPDNELPVLEVPEQLPEETPEAPSQGYEEGVDQGLPEVEDPVDPGYEVEEGEDSDEPKPDHQ